MRLFWQLNRGKLVAVVFSIAITGIVSASPGNYNLQGPRLVGSGVVGNAGQGASVAVSADGNTALIVGPHDNNGQGALWVFTRTNGVWSQQGEKLLGTGGPGIAGPVALSGDGNTAAAGARTGVYVFTRVGGVWIQQGGFLHETGDGASVSSIALSADGNTLAAGDPFSDEAENDCSVTFEGRLDVWTRSSGVWNEQAHLTGGVSSEGGGDSCPTLDGSFLGSTVLLSADGNTLVVEGAGRANVFTRSGTAWSPQIHAFGHPVGLSGDGNTLLTSSFTGTGKMPFIQGNIYLRKAGVWSEFATQIFGVFGDQPTLSALSGDGSTAVGHVRNSDGSSLSLLLFVNTGGAYNLNNTYNGNTQAACAGTGISIGDVPLALSANGDTMIEGTPCDNSLTGGMQPFAAPQLSTTLAHTGNFHRGQIGATYTITVTNAGDRDCHAGAGSAINVIDKLPGSLTPTAMYGNGWNCTLTTLSCTRNDGLPAGASFPSITVTVNVASNAPASLTNVATASGGGSNWGNAKDVTTIVP